MGCGDNLSGQTWVRIGSPIVNQSLRFGFSNVRNINRAWSALVCNQVFSTACIERLVDIWYDICEKIHPEKLFRMMKVPCGSRSLRGTWDDGDR